MFELQMLLTIKIQTVYTKELC